MEIDEGLVDAVKWSSWKHRGTESTERPSAATKMREACANLDPLQCKAYGWHGNTPDRAGGMENCRCLGEVVNIDFPACSDVQKGWLVEVLLVSVIRALNLFGNWCFGFGISRRSLAQDLTGKEAIP